MPQPMGAPGPFYQNAPHRLRRCRKEMPPIGKFLVANESQVGFMNECRGVKSLAWFFMLHLYRSQPTQLGVHQRQELCGRLRLTLLDRGQDAAEVVHRL